MIDQKEKSTEESHRKGDRRECRAAKARKSQTRVKKIFAIHHLGESRKHKATILKLLIYFKQQSVLCGNQLRFPGSNMKSKPLLSYLIAIAVSIASASALATPKAAEQDDAPVTQGADVAKPRLSAKAAKPVKTKFVKKARLAAKGKVHRNAPRKK